MKWRPEQSVRVKAIGLAWQNGRLLASEIYDDAGRVKGVRPLGGHVEFGESWQKTLVREFDEELGIEVTSVGAPMVFENIYSHHDVLGHEIVFAADIVCEDRLYELPTPIEYQEDNGLIARADWYDLDALDTTDIALYPNGLKAALMSRARDEA